MVGCPSPLRVGAAALALAASVVATACGPKARIPPLPLALPGTLHMADSAAKLARALAPVLYLQRDEWFPLERVVAVVHPDRRIIGYHLLWRDDIHGSSIPFTVPTDQEIVWVGYDSTLAPVEMWTYWHGSILHAAWPERRTVEGNVQWGKHAILPRGLIESDLPQGKKLNVYYLFAWLGLPEIWLGKLTRPGPWCFCRGYDRYREWTNPMRLTDRVDIVVRTADPRQTLWAVFGDRYSEKPVWPESRARWRGP